MPRYVTLSRAARLAGVSRGAIQKRIRSGDLTTFEGMVEVNELLRVYPETQMEETALLQRVEEIMESAVNKVVYNKPTLPDADVLAARLGSLSQELAKTKAELASYQGLTDRLEKKIRDGARDNDGTAGEYAAMLEAWLGRALKQRKEFSEVPQQLIAREAFLRIMEANVKVFPSGREFAVQGSDTLLESALKAGQVPVYGCSDGSCGKCRARLVSGKVRAVRQLSDSAVNDDGVLMCACTAMTDLVIEIDEASGPQDIDGQNLHAQVVGVERCSDKVMLVNLRTPLDQRLRFLAGQSATLLFDDRLSEECFIASCPCEERNLQFHLSMERSQPLIEHLVRALENAEDVAIHGPHGEFTIKEDSARPTVFLAFGLGFAPIKSVLEHAMSVDAKESVDLYWFAESEEHYMGNLCRAWGDAIDDFTYHPITVSEWQGGAISRQLTDAFDSAGIHIKACDFYVAGRSDICRPVLDVLYAAGASPGDVVCQEMD